MYSNDTMIEMLVEDDTNSIMSGELWLLISYLEFGHKGYRAYTTDELIKECQERGLFD
jgi:hypothetical protein